MANEGQDAVWLLTADPRKVEQLFQQYERTGSDADKGELAHEICVELNVHTILEEEVFYPACREKGVEHETLDAAQVEHDGAKLLIEELMTQPVRSPYCDAKVSSGGGRGRGHGRWFGDPEGHSRASEEGWEHHAATRCWIDRDSARRRLRTAGVLRARWCVRSSR